MISILHTLYISYLGIAIIRLTVYNNDKGFLQEDSKMLEYISAPEAAKKWGISERRVQKLCEENRIPGVAKFSRMWLIPKDAEKPVDGRTKKLRNF